MFTAFDDRLYSLLSGKVASNSDGINCDEADAVDDKIMCSRDNIAYNDVSEAFCMRLMQSYSKAISCPSPSMQLSIISYRFAIAIPDGGAPCNVR